MKDKKSKMKNTKIKIKNEITPAITFLLFDFSSFL
jgi:hypothetical protein